MSAAFTSRRALLAQLGLACALFVSLAAGTIVSAAAASLRRGVSTEPNSLDPHFVSGNSGATIVYDLFEGLLTQDATGREVPGIAISWTISDDATVYTFALRPGVIWSDGTPLTAGDFEYSLKRVADPKVAAPVARHIDAIKDASAVLAGDLPVEALGARAVDDLTLEITLERPTSYFLSILAHYGTVPVPRHAVEAHGAQWTLPENVVVNGPYKLVEWVNSSHVKAVKNPTYYAADNVRIDDVTYYPVEKTTMALMRFRAGELDIVRTVPLDQLAWIEENYPDQLRRDPIAALSYLLVNHDHEKLKDVRIRKALSISIDRDVIANVLIKDAAGPAYNIVPPKLPGYGANVPDYAERPIDERRTEAKALLAAAGYDESAPLSLKFKFGGQEKSRQSAIAIQSMWKEIGVEIELVNIGSRSIGPDARGGDFDVLRYNYFAPYPDPVVFLNLLKTGQLTNHSRYSNPNFDAALDAADAVADRAARLDALRAVERQLMDDFPVIPIYFEGQFAVVAARVKGWEDNTQGDHLTRYLWIDE